MKKFANILTTCIQLSIATLAIIAASFCTSLGSHIPLLIYGETIGVLSINKPIEDNSILPDELDRLQKFSDQISGSVFNAGLLKETEEARTMADI